MDDFYRRVNRLREGGLTEREAVDAIKRADADQKKYPDKYLQPYSYVKGHKIKNRRFWDLYGDPERYKQKVGEKDFKQLEQQWKDEEERFKFSQRHYA